MRAVWMVRRRLIHTHTDPTGTPGDRAAAIAPPRCLVKHSIEQTNELTVLHAMVGDWIVTDQTWIDPQPLT